MYLFGVFGFIGNAESLPIYSSCRFHFREYCENKFKTVYYWFPKRLYLIIITFFFNSF